MNRLFLSLITCVLLAGCALNPLNWGLPSKKAERAENRVVKTEKAIDQNKEDLHGKSVESVFAADLTLALDPDPNRYSQVAKNFTGRSLLITGTPDLKVAKEYEGIVKGLISTNQLLVEKAEKALDAKDKDIYKLQAKTKILEETLEKKDTALRELAIKNGELANFKVLLFRYIKFAIYGIIFCFIASIITNHLPPPYNLLSAPFNVILGGAGKMVYGLFPKVREISGSVSTQAYQTSENTLKALVNSIEQIRTKKPEVFSGHLEDVLKSVLDRENREKVIDIKKELGKI